MATGRWHHLTLTWRGDKSDLYVDGVLCIPGERRYWRGPTGSHIVVGGGLHGTVDDIRIYSRELQSHLVKQLPELTR